MENADIEDKPEILNEMTRKQRIKTLIFRNYALALFGGVMPKIEKTIKRVKDKVVLGKMVKVCPGKRHAWYELNGGLIRKPWRVS